MARAPKLIVLDYNGTLQDDLHHIFECGVERIFRQFGLQAPTLDEYRDEITSDFMNSIYWPRGIPRDVTDKDLNVIMAEGFKEKGTPAPLFPDAAHVLELLYRRGYSLAISSAYAEKKLHDALQRFDIAKYFFRVDSDIRDKTASFTSIIDELGVSADDVVVVGDTQDDADGAHNVGALPVIVTNGFHTEARLASLRPRIPDLVLVPNLSAALEHIDTYPRPA